MPTFGAMADKFIAAHEGGWKNRKHARQWDATLRKYAAPLRDMPVDQIATADVLACLSPIWNERPETGSRVRGRIEVILASAAVAGHIPEDRPNPARWQNWLDLMLANPKKVGKPRGHYKALPYEEGPGPHGEARQDRHRRVAGAAAHHPVRDQNQRDDWRSMGGDFVRRQCLVDPGQPNEDEGGTTFRSAIRPSTSSASSMRRATTGTRTCSPAGRCDPVAT